jgi:hypothetical protein
MALALQVIFGAAPRELFPDLYEQVEDGVMQRARDLYERLEGKTGGRSRAKLDLLEDMAAWKEDNADRI